MERSLKASIMSVEDSAMVDMVNGQTTLALPEKINYRQQSKNKPRLLFATI